MSADALKKLLLTAAVAALAAVALAGTTVAVVALAGGLEGIYIVGGASAAAVPAPAKAASAPLTLRREWDARSGGREIDRMRKAHDLPGKGKSV